jgi:hypothetical protein
MATLVPQPLVQLISDRFIQLNDLFTKEVPVRRSQCVNEHRHTIN